MLADLEEKCRRRARRNLFAFAQLVAPSDYQWGWHHNVLYRSLQTFAEKRIPLLIIEMPPGHGKSEGLSRNLPAFIFGQNRDARIIGTSHTLDLAAEMNRDVQRIMDGDAYRGLFPETRLGAQNVRTLSAMPRRNSDIFDITGARGYYKAAGVGVGITGRRFDYGLIDDSVKDRESANSPTFRDGQWRWYNSVFRSRAAKGAVIGIVGTRWHEDDLIGRIKKRAAENSKAPQPVVLTLPALMDDRRHPEDPRQFGEALWPWFKPKEELEQERESDPLDFTALYQQDPRAEGATEWGADLFPDSIWFDDWPDDLTLLVISLDPSKGKDSKHGDYGAFVALARDRAGTLWVEAHLGRWPTTRIVAEGIEFSRRVKEEAGAHLEGFGVESDQFQELLADEFIRQTAAAGFTLPIYKMTTGNVNKEVRIRRLTPEFTRKKTRFRSTPGTRLLVEQLKQFPTGKYDDGPDAMEYARRLAIFIQNGKRAKR